MAVIGMGDLLVLPGATAPNLISPMKESVKTVITGIPVAS
jgi:hypothetical protein